jgi:ribosomal-protein-alanine N-acetyltransferase
MAERDCTIRLAQRGDAATIAAMSRDFVEAGLGWHYKPAVIARLICDPETITIVACDARCIAGFSILSLASDRAHLVLLAVRPEARRRGIAGRMLRWVLASAAVAGVASVHVELREANAAAIALYRSAGFTEAFRLPGYYRGRETAIRMVLALRSSNQALPRWKPPAAKRPR